MHGRMRRSRMLERFSPLLRIICLLLAGLVLYQIARILARPDSMKHLGVADTFSVLNITEATPGNPGTNAMKGTNAAPGRSSVKKQTELPPAVQARVDRITQSEILGPVIRPLPMALIGIAGKDVFFRAPNGQTGLLREGE